MEDKLKGFLSIMKPGWVDFCLPGYFLFCEMALALVRGGHFRYPLLAAGFALGAGFLLSALFGLFSPKVKRILTILVMLGVSVLFAVEAVVRSVFLTYMEPHGLLSGAGGVLTGYTGEFFRSVLYGLPRIFLFLGPCLLLAVLMLKKKIRGGTSEEGKAFAPVFFAIGFALTLALSVFSSDGAFGTLYNSRISFSNSTETFGLLTASRLFIGSSLGHKKPSGFSGPAESVPEIVPESADESAASFPELPESLPEIPDPTVIAHIETPELPVEMSYGKNEMAIDFSGVLENESTRSLTEYILSQEASSKNEYTGLFAGKNLILIAAESYADAFICPELTPTLWRLSRNGFYFSNYCQPEWGGSTTTGEMSFLTGLAPQWGDDSMIKTSGHNMHFTMGNRLKAQGYNSWAFHNGAYDYYSRQMTHQNLGYDAWIANETGMADLCGQSYPTDTSMIENTIGFWIDAQPFSVYYMTLSGHAPYTGDLDVVKRYYSRVSAVYGEKYAEKVIYYICCQMELENMLSIIVDRLTEAGIADDTVIALVGDHYPYGLGAGEAWENDRSYISDLMGTPVDYDWQRDKNGLIIWSGCLENEDRDMQCEISSPVMSLDVLPTLLNLFGIEFDSRLLPGRDVFADTQPLIFWSSLDWVTERGKYDWGGQQFFPADGYETDQAYIDAVNRMVESKFQMSRVIVDTDYYRMLFGDS